MSISDITLAYTRIMSESENAKLHVFIKYFKQNNFFLLNISVHVVRCLWINFHVPTCTLSSDEKERKYMLILVHYITCGYLTLY